MPGHEVLVLVLDAGGGHRAAARALTDAADVAGVRWGMRVENLQEVLAPADFSRRLTGRPLEETYNGMVRRRRTRFLVPLLRTLQWGIGGLEGRLASLVAERLREVRPALVVSVVPNLNGVIARAVRDALPGVPFAVVMTDLADFPPRFWVHGSPDAVVVPTGRAAQQAVEAGLSPRRIWRTSGLPLHPRFYGLDVPATRLRVRNELGIPDGAITVLAMFGGKGSPELAPLATLLAKTPDRHVIAVCGDNPLLLESLLPAAGASEGRLHALGFTDRIPELLAAADLLVSKPGPGAVAEALHIGRPLVVTSNPHTIPQERYNARYLAEKDLGVVVRRWRDIPPAVDSLVAERGRLDRLHDNVQALPRNRAVFEVVSLLDGLLSGGVPATG